MDDLEILNRFLKVNLNIHPDALREIKSRENVGEAIDEIISRTEKTEEKPAVITPEYVKSLEVLLQPKMEEGDGEGLEVKDEGEEKEKGLVVLKRVKRFLAQEYESKISIREDKDITNKSFSQGNIEGFVEYFNNRYERLSKILRERNHLREAATIEWIKNTSFRGKVKCIGMVNDVRKSQKGHVIIKLEDPTGVIPVIILNSNQELLRVSKEIVKDEVIGIEGNVGKNNDIIIANEISFPDLPVNRETRKSDDPVALAIVSDTHVGSTKFLETEFLKFIKWLNGDLGNVKQRQLAERVKYLIVGGDLVDGVGIYPGQENELVIKDIHEQYNKVTEYFSSIPEHIEMIVMPGNHDATRQAEPQPAISEEFIPRFYQDPRIHMVGNPCYVNLHGVEVLTYHGRSLDDIVSTIPNLSYSKPEKAMLPLLKKRHLSPIYGGKVPLSPESFDYMLIEEVPDIFHFAHVHTVGVANYRGTTLVNSGTFQEQTSFQRRQNMRPDPARVPIIDLQTHRTTLMKFIT